MAFFSINLTHCKLPPALIRMHSLIGCVVVLLLIRTAGVPSSIDEYLLYVNTKYKDLYGENGCIKK